MEISSLAEMPVLNKAPYAASLTEGNHHMPSAPQVSQSTGNKVPKTLVQRVTKPIPKGEG